MTRIVLLGVLALSVVTGCDKDPASQVRIAARPNIAANPATPKWTPFRPELCNVAQSDTAGSSRFTVTGPCAFTHNADQKCRRTVDDFYVSILRNGPGVATVATYVNVEQYKGPGPYDNAEIFLTVQDGTAYYHWSADSVAITVGPQEKFVDLGTVRLDAEPPNTGTETIAGRIVCGALATSTTHAIPK